MCFAGDEKRGDLHMVNQRVAGVFFGVAAGAMWAVEAVLGKMLFSSLTFVQVTASEVFYAALTAFAYLVVKGERLKPNRRNLGNFLVVGLVGTVFAPLLYFFGLTQTFAVNATLIAHLQPLFVAIFGSFLLKERLHRRDFAAGAFIGLAVIMITGRTAENLSQLKLGNLGDAVVFLAMLCWAIVAVPGKQLAGEVSSIVIVGYRFLIASAVFLPMVLFLRQFVLSSVYQMLLGVIVGLGYIFYYEGLKRAKASQVALTELSAPFFAAILAWNLLGETTTPMQAIGALLLASGLYVLTRQEPISEPSKRETNQRKEPKRRQKC